MTCFADLVATSATVRASSSRREKAECLSRFLQRVDADEIELAVKYLVGALPQGRIGIGPAAVRDSVAVPSVPVATLDLSDLDRCFTEIAVIEGARSKARRRDELHRLLGRSTSSEQQFIRRLLVGELRQGAVEGLMLDAIAIATRVSPDKLRRATMLAGDLAQVARAALETGEAGLESFRMHPLQPVKPMLAQPQTSVDAAVEALGEAAFEYKMDGVRIQVHKAADEVRVFSRRLNDITAQLPEVVDAVSGCGARNLILDGEVLALRDGQAQPFQVTMQRIGRQLDVARKRTALPLSAFYFDCLMVDDTELIDCSWRERRGALEQVIESPALMPVLVTADPVSAQAMLDEALRAGHEGVMAKAVDSTYEAGARGGKWLKVKPVHTLDLVVLGAEWGSGRRRGWLSNLHLGAREPASNGFIMVGKTFKGLTDAMLEYQTRRLLELEVERREQFVRVRPELVVEIAFGAVQSSPQYPGGVALRFARVRRYREDKHPDQIDSLQTLKRIRDRGADLENRP